VTSNSSNRDRFLALDAGEFIMTMRNWAEAFMPLPGVPIPCISVEELAAITVPVMVVRSGVSDIHHGRATSEAVAAMIPSAQLAEPPWGDTEWMDRLGEVFGGGRGLFCRWPLLVPQILGFAKPNS
jgi:hypothetical protein